MTQEQVNNAWQDFAAAAEARRAAGADFLGYRVVTVAPAKVTIERVATGSPVVITRAAVESAIAKLEAAGGSVPRRSIDYTVAKESTIVELHPAIEWSEDKKTIRLV